MSSERIVSDSAGGVVFDPVWTPTLNRDWFRPSWWRQRNALRELSGGRGGVLVVDTPVGEAVLRHYHRGGSVARLMGDRFLWTGRERARSIREFRLLQQLQSMGLPAPVPLGGAWTRDGIHYRADLITACISSTETLAAMLPERVEDLALAAAVGRCIRRFHVHGVWHADLNAHNILVADDGQVSLIDFDRGRLRQPQSGWWQANLQRLHRSLCKISGCRADDPPAWLQPWWKALLLEYQREETVA